jgi:hypothetical protein
VLLLLVTVNIIPSSPVLFAPVIEAIRSSETSGLRKTTRRIIPEGDILHSPSRENLKSYTALTGWPL